MGGSIDPASPKPAKATDLPNPFEAPAAQRRPRLLSRAEAALGLAEAEAVKPVDAPPAPPRGAHAAEDNEPPLNA